MNQCHSTSASHAASQAASTNGIIVYVGAGSLASARLAIAQTILLENDLLNSTDLE